MGDDQVKAATKPPRDPRAKRQRAFLVWGLTVAAATIGIVLIAAVGPILVGQQTPQPDVATSAPSQESGLLLTQAQNALAAGDTTAALSLARSAAAADPTNTSASELVTQLSKGSPTSSGSGNSSAPGGSADTTTPTTAEPSTSVSPDVGYTRPVADLAALLPASLAGYAFESAVVTPDSVSISASPEQAGASSGRLIWTVRDTKSLKGAKAFVRKTTKVLYAKQNKKITVDGVPAYYGTDGERIATVTYARGRYVFELLLSSEMGSAMGKKAATAFRDTPLQ